MELTLELHVSTPRRRSRITPQTEKGKLKSPPFEQEAHIVRTRVEPESEKYQFGRFTRQARARPAIESHLYATGSVRY